MIKKRSLVAGASMIAVLGFGIGLATGQSSGTMATLAEMDWQPIAEESPVDFVVLWGDPATNEHARLYKLPPGLEVSVHMHTAEYHGINLTGTWRHYIDGGESRDLPPGSYVHQTGGVMHGDVCVGPEECIILSHQHAPSDFIPKEQ